MLRGCSVGLVLGGGGARGSSHVGMIKVNYFYVVTNIFWSLTVQYFQSILEAGIPIDHVAGVSIGSCMGGLWAQERDISQVTVKARNFSHKMSQKWRMALDLTWPHSSMMTGFGFNSLIEETFGETNIEVRRGELILVLHRFHNRLYNHGEGPY